jgi:hypothetical protein
MKTFMQYCLLAFLSVNSHAQKQPGNPAQFNFMLGDWEVTAKIRNSPASYIEGKGAVNVYFNKSNDTLYAVMKIKFLGFEVNGVTKRTYNKQKGSWDISWNPENNEPVVLVDGKFEDGRCVEINYGKDDHNAFIGRLVIYNISNDHFSVRKDRLYDDGTLMPEIWAYEAKKKRITVREIK